jgi:DNA polymerase III alpha subunit (gram-positive type)
MDRGVSTTHGNDAREPCAGDASGAEPLPMTSTRWTCPSCKAGDLIRISMVVGGRDLAFSTCHHCEAKWWFRDGEEVPLSSVIGLVVQK